MTAEPADPDDSHEVLFEDAPGGYLTTDPDGRIVRVNRTFEDWLGRSRDELVGTRFQDLLTPGGRIYHETHYRPLLTMQGAVREIALDLLHADGRRLPALVNATLSRRADGAPRTIRTLIFPAQDRRSYEEELVRAGNREREVALELQRSLLAGELPADPGVELAVQYRAADAGLDVGGDWYDAFWIEPGAVLALCVGDVVGRGLHAAAAMGQLRSAVRALAAAGAGPGALLDALEAYAERHGVGRMTTVAYAELDVAGQRLRYACAGHPPPALLVPGRDPFLAWEARSVPLGASPEPLPDPRTEAELAVPAGSTILLFTDGVFERAGLAPDETLARLLAEAGARRDAPPAELAAGVVEAMLADQDRADDVCLLAARTS